MRKDRVLITIDKDLHQFCKDNKINLSERVNRAIRELKERNNAA